MGKKNKKSNPRIPKRPIQKMTNKLARVVGALCFVIILLNIVFATKVAVPIGLYFLIMYLTASSVAVLLVLGLINNIQLDKILKEKKKNYKQEKVFNWIARALLVIVFFADLIYFWIPMSADLPRLVIGNYQEIVGTVEKIEFANSISTPKGKWLEREQDVYFKEVSTGKVLKIVFHANNPKATYYTNRIYYLPHTKWGIKAE